MAKSVYPLKEIVEVKQRRVEDAEKVVIAKKLALEKEEQKLAEREAEREHLDPEPVGQQPARIAAARVAHALFWPGEALLHLSAAAWIAAFLGFALLFGPFILSPRLK